MNAITTHVTALWSKVTQLLHAKRQEVNQKNKLNAIVAQISSDKVWQMSYLN